ncbi:hypothetical protein DFQ28_006752 [Apophysomyces sp. BC1034]|nr:hypothetical protein DFQ29_001266 [Apophysomyces sp. BC1021]KAG0193011.1 hypothetical protein DFQ28_006752 [Apophysomyces sp. BC1034]
MTMEIEYKEEIATCLLQVEKNGKVSWDDFLTAMESFIIDNYAEQNIDVYKNQWRFRFKKMATLLNLEVAASNKDQWLAVESQLNAQQQQPTNDLHPNASSSTSVESLPSSTSLKSLPLSTFASSSKSRRSSASASSSSSLSNCVLSAVDIEHVKAAYGSIKGSDKWILSTGTVVEDVMQKLALESMYEHPVHSLILDTSDKIWENYFTEDELEQITTYNRKCLPAFPDGYQEYLDSYDKNLSAKEVYQQACSHFFDPTEQHAKKWMQQSLMMAANLFLYNNKLKVDDFSEADFLHRVWPFVYHLFDDDYIEAKLGERCSSATAKRKNNRHQLEAIERRQQRVMGTRVDILFKYGGMELGCAEVGKELITTVDDKYMNDGMMKLPKSLRDMLSSLVDSSQDQVNHVMVVGFLVMGK